MASRSRSYGETTHQYYNHDITHQAEPACRLFGGAELVRPRRTLPGSVLAPRSLRGSLNRLLPPSILIFRVTSVSGLVAGVDAMLDGVVVLGGEPPEMPGGR